MNSQSVIDKKFYFKALVLLTAVNYFNYIDRYILSAVLQSIKVDLSLSDLQAGLLATAFMIPYMLSAPFFGRIGDQKDRSKVVAFGVTLWSLATFATGWARNFAGLVSARVVLGIGESAFTSTSYTYLSDVAPADKKGRALSILGTALPVGAAIGFVAGGLLSKYVGWRNAFFIVGVPGLVLAFFLYRLGDPVKSEKTVQLSYASVVKLLVKSKRYVMAVLGYSAYTFVIGGVAHWIPSYFQREWGWTEMNSNMIFGGIAVVSGLVGTLTGGWLADHLQKKWQGKFSLEQRSASLLVCSISMLVGLPFFFGMLLSTDVYLMIFCLVVTQFCFFVSTSPVNLALIESSPQKYNNSAMALSILMSHLLGDAISSPLIGYVSDVTGSLKNGLLVCSPVMVLCVYFWWAGSHKKLETI